MGITTVEFREKKNSFEYNFKTEDLKEVNKTEKKLYKWDFLVLGLITAIILIGLIFIIIFIVSLFQNIKTLEIRTEKNIISLPWDEAEYNRLKDLLS